jgi:hypothetical protein
VMTSPEPLIRSYQADGAKSPVRQQSHPQA